MRIHHKYMSEVVRRYAVADPESYALVRKDIRHWRAQVMAGIEITLPGMPGGTFSELAEFDQWCERKFPRLYLKTD